MIKGLKQLTDLLPAAAIQGRLEREIRAVAHDSRQVVPGTLFVCLSGVHADGHDFITAAVQQGAAAVLVEKDVPAAGCEDITIIKVADTRKAMQVIVPYFFDYPGHKLRMIGVTGTNGKTTTTYLIRSILRQAGHKAGLIGTIQTMIGDQILPVKNTTPDVIELQSILAEMVANGMEYAIMEVSSHALALGRIAGCEFDVAVFTNMTQDHLDFHQTFANYIETKAELFRSLNRPDSKKQGKTAIINFDDPVGKAMAAHAGCPVISYGINSTAVLTADSLAVAAAGSSFSIKGPFGAMPLTLNITGMFNVYNVLAAAGAALAEKIDPAIIRQALEGFSSVPGRFELVQAGQPFTVIVDYAHTPDGLENVLKTAKQFATAKIIVVFGCGGDRDRTKRPLMGKLAAVYGDIVLATSDNPRSEEPGKILEDIEVGLKDALAAGHSAKSYQIIIDRRQAITQAIQLAGPQDVVLIAGKGHETYQILKDRTIDFDDRQVAREVIREMKINA
ncbi:UDP-N-acetylmuramoyl-L-alanyl-D-glutamate--2,6-diaminopimelate ligase [Sporomusa termitida]|uniref:UDP-N-acetylmuramoyl-L-alanyl-D-glutamate--2,6-diaminopimelate ligase n=1 Tax=Sporomusa termitida TaxID=2377 RepID=A0A517DSQ5_9FIRM|nr:UDP-N-acetylmuramoyl-L-alanyl-D-glutamate--2,6-diaminopimelate ligase [Sporomusa termitida]QDR80380.1 UDP-N-acetylmuramoyl-L-alanyl-D-glutamate--2,6-diaminopimelate ligase [Sporomusa termitida]